MPAKNQPTYKVYKYVGGSSGDPLSLVKTSNDAYISIDWPLSQPFKFSVDARSRRDLAGLTKYRKVDEVSGTTDICSYVPLPGEVRLKHEQTARCMFGNHNPGGPVAIWGPCWKDPNMGFLLEPLSGNEFQIRHRSTNQCLYVDTPNGGVVKNWPCGVDPKMVWIKDPLPGTNRFRIRNKATGRCIYARNSNAAPVQAWGPCWDDPAMAWVIEPF
jgi:hypothetical protein